MPSWTALLLVCLAGMTPQEQVIACAELHDLDPALAREVAFLESSWRTDAVGDDGESVGLYQFKSETWQWMTDLAGMPDWADPANRTDSRMAAYVATWAMANGYGEHWSTWELAQRRAEE